jgi:hypothetical protein
MLSLGCLTVLLIGAVPHAAWGDAFLIFDETFKRGQGRPVREVRQVIATNPDARYVVRVTAADVSSGRVTLNGVPLIQPSNFRRRRLVVEHDVTLTRVNELIVELRGQPGGILSVAIVGFADPGADRDGDGLSDAEEEALGTDPTQPDTDGDELTDGDEVQVYETMPTSADTDGDGVADGAEVLAGTSPLIADADRDGLPDAHELTAGSNPLVPDSDLDGVWDGLELMLGTDPLSAADSPAAVPDGTLLAQSAGHLALIDLATGVVAHAGPLFGAPGGLAVDNARVVWVATPDGLVSVDPLTAVPTLPTPFQTAAGDDVSVISMAFDPTGADLYGVEAAPGAPGQPSGQVVRIDRATAIVTRLQGAGLEPIHALAFDDLGRLWGTASDATGGDRLVRLNLGTGLIEDDIDLIAAGPVFGLAFSPSGQLHASVVDLRGFESAILTLDQATGASTVILEFDVALFGLSFMMSGAPAPPTVLTEDFTDDANPALPGFASSVFQHSLDPSHIIDEAGFPTLDPYPSSPHALVILGDGPDSVTFALNPGETIARARVRANTLFGGGGGRVEIVGVGDTRSFQLPFGGVWQLIEAASTDIGDNGFALGAIVEIRLMDGEVLYDDLEIEIVR